MADTLLELLQPHLTGSSQSAAGTVGSSPVAHAYLDRLTTLSVGHLTATEHASLQHTSQTTVRSLQALSKRSHTSITNAADHLNHLPESINALREQVDGIQSYMTGAESSINEFAQKYERNTDNEILVRRKTAALLNRNAERVGNILELPSLLESTINSSAASSGAVNGASTVSTGPGLSGYASALDVHAHVRRLNSLYPKSELVAGVTQQADLEISNMVTALITTLQSPTLKLAVAMRTIGWLRRVAPELAMTSNNSTSTILTPVTVNLKNINEEGALGSLFLVCRFATLRRTLEALEPLRQLADNESERRRSQSNQKAPEKWSGGVQSERYLKRFIEIFREQSFAIVSMYKSIFPTALAVPGSTANERQETSDSPKVNGESATEHNPLFEDRASALAAFVPELIEMLVENLRKYLPNLSDRSSRDSLLSQVLFCAGSLGRLGADFGLMLALLEEDMQDLVAESDEPEWVTIIKKHRVQASRLEVLASGVGTSRKASIPAVDSRPQSPTVAAR